MKKEPLVCIIILTWNGKTDTIECLRSLQKISYRNIKIVVSDNNSTDDTVKTIRRQFPTVHLIQNKGNSTYTDSINQAIISIKQFNPEYILLLNNDTVVHREFLTGLVHRAVQNRNNGIIVSKMYYYDQKNMLWYAGGIVDFSHGIIAHRGIGEIDTGKYDTAEETGYSTGCSTLYNVSMLKNIGLFDESYPMYVNDVEISERARRAGYLNIYEPASVIWHKVTRTRGEQNPFKEYQKSRFSVRFFRTYDAKALKKYLLVRILQSMRLAFAGRLKIGIGILHGLFDGYRFTTPNQIPQY